VGTCAPSSRLGDNRQTDTIKVKPLILYEERNMEQQLEAFVQHLQVVRRLSSHTVENYQRDIAELLKWCASQSLTSWQSVSNAHLRLYVAQKHRKGLSGRSIARKLSAIRSFYNFLIKQGQLSANPCSDIPVPKSQKKLPKALNIDQVSYLLDESDDSWHACRDSAMFELFYSSGLRLSELVSLNLDNIDFAQQQLNVVGKGSKARYLPVGSKAVEAIRLWLPLREQVLASKGAASELALFISQQGRRINVRTVQLRLKARALALGLPSNVSPHTLRHTFASHMLESSQNLRAVQELLGHADISTTQVYTHLDFTHLAKVYDAAHPRAKRKKRS